MKITVLGSGSAFSDSRRFNSAYLVEDGDLCLMIDCGSDALRALQNAKIDLFSVQDIYLTHMHADHCGGLPAVLTGMDVLKREKKLTVHVPAPQLAFVRSWLANLFIFNERMSFETEMIPLNAGKIRLGNGIELEFVETRHLDKYAEIARRSGIASMSFSVIVRKAEKVFFFSSDVASIDEIELHLDASLSFVEASHVGLEGIARVSGKRNESIFFTHVPQELEAGGIWRKELNERFGVKKPNMVYDGQVFEI
jgi:hypothetical protein